jgi:predicted transcriptional regulator
MNSENATNGNVKPLRKTPKRKESVKMWGKLVLRAGFTIIPSTLLLKQAKLDLDSVDVNILLHLIVAWWKKEKPPYLSKKTIAARLKVDPSTVQRHIRKMEGLEILQRIERRGANKGRQTNQYDLRPLANKLHVQALAVLKERAPKKGGQQ